MLNFTEESKFSVNQRPITDRFKLLKSIIKKNSKM